MKKLKVENGLLLLIAITAQIAGMLLRFKSTGNYLTDGFAGYIWGTEGNTYFPFLNWIIFPVAGIMLGKAYQHLQNKDVLYKWVSPVSFVLGLGYLILAYLKGYGMFGENSSYYFMGIVDVFFVVLLAIGLFGINYFLLRSFKNCKFKTLTRLARNINTVYCIHWVLIAIASNTIYLINDEISFGLATIIGLIILAVSDGLAVLWTSRKKAALLKKQSFI